ncbi:MAG: SUMF1/EgtB/PvdO family nonheme iron enzyme [Planctomycetota bacterium]|jgi:formylglycine-generating enzyme required for sulfatase activity
MISAAVLVVICVACLRAEEPTNLTPKAKVSAAERIHVDATLYKKHQVCLADVRNTAGMITAISIVADVDDQYDLDGLKVCVFWDGQSTPFIACSLGDFLKLFGDDRSGKDVPDLVFSNGFRIFIESPSGKGGKLAGYISYKKTGPPGSSRRVRFDPDLGVTTPQLAETVRMCQPDVRSGRGEAIILPNAGFESGGTRSWHDFSWAKGSFRIYPTGTEGVRAHSGKFMVGTVVPGEPTRGCKGLVRVDGLVPGYRYRLSAWVNTYNFDQEPKIRPVPWNAKVRLGINTTGTFLTELYPEGGDLWTMDFSHRRFYFAHCWGPRASFADSQDHWSQISVEARAKGEVASILLRAVQLYGHRGNRKWSFFDDVTLENVPVPMGAIAGRVVGDNGKGEKQVIVITDPWGFVAKTRGDGRFEIVDIPEGIYKVQVSNDRNTASVSEVRVFADRTTTVSLNPGGNPSGKVLAGNPGDSENQLINAGFESGDMIGWQRAYDCDAMEVIQGSGRVVPPFGRFMFGGEHIVHYAGAREIVYQRVPAIKGSRWTLSGHLLAHSADGSSDGAQCRLVVGPEGGTDFTIASDYHNGLWQRVSLGFKAGADVVSVGVEMIQRPLAKSLGVSTEGRIVGAGAPDKSRHDYNAYYCDELRMVPAGPGTEMAKTVGRKGKPKVKQGKRPELSGSGTLSIVLPDGKTTMYLIHVPAGEFLMGVDSSTGYAKDDEFPRHRVRLDSYWIGRYEVTNLQYKAFCDATGYPYPPDPAFSKIPWAHPERCYDYGDYFGRMPDYPVVNVTWYDAVAFCRWAGLRLSKEAEWEMAARGLGDTLRTYPWGEQTNPAWTTRTRDNMCIQQIPDWFLYTAPKGSFEVGRPWNVGKSILGLCSMGGNVREWCSDVYGAYPSGEQTNPMGPAEGMYKVLRGGCWQGVDYGVQSRCSYRFKWLPGYYQWGTTGFRAAADAK